MATAKLRFPPCPVCEALCETLDRVDFNKSCEEARGLKLPNSGTLVEYVLCDSCGKLLLRARVRRVDFP